MCRRGQASAGRNVSGVHQNIEALRARGELGLTSTLERLIIRANAMARSLGPRNANGPGTSPSLHELQLGQNFDNAFEPSRVDFMKILLVTPGG